MVEVWVPREAGKAGLRYAVTGLLGTYGCQAPYEILGGRHVATTQNGPLRAAFHAAERVNENLGPVYIRPAAGPAVAIATAPDGWEIFVGVK